MLRPSRTLAAVRRGPLRSASAASIRRHTRGRRRARLPGGFRYRSGGTRKRKCFHRSSVRFRSTHQRRDVISPTHRRTCRDLIGPNQRYRHTRLAPSAFVFGPFRCGRVPARLALQRDCEHALLRHWRKCWAAALVVLAVRIRGAADPAGMNIACPEFHWLSLHPVRNSAKNPRREWVEIFAIKTLREWVEKRTFQLYSVWSYVDIRSRRPNYSGFRISCKIKQV